MATRTIRKLLSDDPDDSEINIQLINFHDARYLRSLAEALGSSEHARVICLTFNENFGAVEPSLPRDHWDPLLREIEIRTMLEEVKIWCNPIAEHCIQTPLYRDKLFPALQRNRNIIR